MTAQIIPFAFEDQLVRSVMRDDEPWFVGKDVCRVLEIKDHHQAMERLDGDERGGYTVPTPQGEQTVIVVSEPGVYRLIFTSRKAEAERFKRWLAHEVLPQLRRTGAYALPDNATEQSDMPAITIGGEPVAVVAQKLSMVREARLIHGLERARMLWEKLGLPRVPGGQEAAQDDARACLAHLLGAVLIDDPDFNKPRTVRHAIEMAIDGGADAEAALRARGVRVMESEEGFAVANSHPAMLAFFAGTRWANGRHAGALRHHPMARRIGPTRFTQLVMSRAVLFLVEAIDEPPPAA